MRRLNLLLSVAGLVGFVLFFCLLTWLLLLRYERGDIYPAYSTLRADPLGTRAYYEALASLPSYAVIRGFTSLHRELEHRPGTLFFLGLDARDIASFTKDESNELDEYVKNGGRVVMTFSPQDPNSRSSIDSSKDADKEPKPVVVSPKKSPLKPDGKSPAPEAPSDEDATPPKTEQERYEWEEFRKEKEREAKDNLAPKNEIAAEKFHPSLAAIWGFGWDVATVIKPKEEDQSDADSNSPPPPEKEMPEVLAMQLHQGNTEPSVPWKSALYFIRLEPEWQKLYSAKFNPVLVRRSWGKGEIVLASDSYFLSNEGLRNDRRPALIGFLTGRPGNLVFDETHLGTEEQEGVMYLAEKFRLEGYLYGMLVVVLLFLWRNSMPLVPPRASNSPTQLGGAVSGKDSHSGLVNLLRRNIAAPDILKTSFGEWRRNVTPGRQHLQSKVAEMETVLATAQVGKAGQIVQSYHQLREINTPSRAKGNYATKS
jgi:hypothetical protein